MEQIINGEKWSYCENGKKHIITDKDMVAVVMDKISGNLLCYIQDIKDNKDLEC